LLVTRAQAFQPDFALTPATAPAVAAICHHLDGLPLAIELAAARIKLLPPPELLKRLGTRFTVLTGGPRDAPARQQTLRNAIAWSHDLLTEEGQALLRRLAVFAGGCTLEAVDAVANPSGDLDTLEGVAALVDESLLRQTDADTEARFTMLETVREFAGERLATSREEGPVRRQHAAYFAGLAQALRHDIDGTDHPSIVTRL
jgi:predicted ATPase